MRRHGRGPRSLPRLEEPPNDAAVVALRRVRSWKSERHRRLRQRALEIAERCRELRSQFDPGYEWERPLIPEQVFDAPVLVAARRCTCIPGCGHRCAYVAPLETDVWGDDEATSPVSRSANTGLYEARGQHGPCLTCLGKHLDRCIICMDVLQAGCTTTLRGRGDEIAALDDPVVRFPCNHYFHSACIRARCEVGAKHNEEGDPLQFDFLHCPLCRTAVTLPQTHHPAEGNAPPLPTVALEFLGTQLSRDLAPLLKRQLELRALVWSLAPGEEMFRKVFQVCQRCQMPFCSGSVSCHGMAGRRADDDSGAGVGLGDEPGLPRPRVKLDALCGPCSYALPAGKPRVCPMHGTAAIAWKCRYCCSIATYECFSGRQQLHVCDTCHDPRILEQLFDFDRMDNMLPVGEYGFCPIKRNVLMPNGGRNLRKKGRGGASKLGRGGVLSMDLSLLRTMERRLAVVTAKEVRAAQELQEWKDCQHILPDGGGGGWGAKKGEPGGALNRLRRKAHSLKVEREDLARLVDGCNLSGKGACHFGGVHPPAGIEYCLGCTLCN